MDDKYLPIHHDTFTHLSNNCIKLKNLFDKKTELGDFICENFSQMNAKITRSNFEKYQTVPNPPMLLIIILQRTEYEYYTGLY